jgi:hypothetical protein
LLSPARDRSNEARDQWRFGHDEDDLQPTWMNVSAERRVNSRWIYKNGHKMKRAPESALPEFGNQTSD